MTNPKTINLDNEIKQCTIVKPYEALQSEFAKKLITHLASKSKFKEQLIRDIAQKLEDETQTLTPDEGIDFLELLDENKDFFNEIIKRYKGQFPAWIQSGINSDTLDMKQEDHVLYRN